MTLGLALSTGYRLRSAAARAPVPSQTEALPSQTETLPSQAEDVAQIYRLVSTFHRAATIQSLDLMMSLWADDATFAFQDETYAGKDRIREWFAYEAGAFRHENYWVALTTLPTIRIAVSGDQATLYFGRGARRGGLM